MQTVPEARESLRAGDLHGALAQLKAEVRRTPREARLRTFLFQLFCVTGEWERAVTQLSVAAELDPAALPMAQAYRALIRCELLRARVFAGRSTPTVFGEPAAWVMRLVEANRLLGEGAHAQAAVHRDQAFEDAGTVSGSIDGRSFEWVADADMRLGPILEAMVDGKYLWVPFDRLRSIVLEPPADLRDQVWMPARFTWSNGGETEGFVPTRYPGSEAAGDAAIALSRRTEWRDAAGGWVLGLGQRMLASDAGDEVSLMDLRRLEIAATAESGA